MSCIDPPNPPLSTLPSTRQFPPQLRGIALQAISLRGAMTAEEVGKALSAVPDAQEAEINGLLETLVARGDLCRFETSGAPVFASTPRRSAIIAQRRVESGSLPEKRLGSVGPVDDADALLHLLGPPTWRTIDEGYANLEEFARESNITGDPEVHGWRQIADGGKQACSLVRLPETAPAQLIRLSLLTEDWPLEDRSKLDDALRLWVGFAETEQDYDPVQDRVISRCWNARTLVVAGPGAGKTHTVRARLKALVENGVPAPSITVVAFSRSAVAELRQRLKGLEDAASLDITTLDSLAGRLVAAALNGQVAGDHEATIRSLNDLIHRRNRTVSSWLSERQHVIFDEAQDIVGVRRELMIAILSELSEQCGATVFCDPAQAIYDYSVRRDGQVCPKPIDSLLVEHAEFEREFLPRNHRTSNQVLLRLAKEGSEVVEDSPDGNTALRRMRELLREVCTEPHPEINGGLPYPTLSLFRTGGEAALNAARLASEGLPVRMTGGNMSTELPAFAPAWGRAGNECSGRKRKRLPRGSGDGNQ